MGGSFDPPAPLSPACQRSDTRATLILLVLRNTRNESITVACPALMGSFLLMIWLTNLPPSASSGLSSMMEFGHQPVTLTKNFRSSPASPFEVAEDVAPRWGRAMARTTSHPSRAVQLPESKLTKTKLTPSGRASPLIK